MNFIIKNVINRIVEILNGYGLAHNEATTISEFSMFILLLIVAYFAYRITWFLMRKFIIPIIQKSKTQFDDILLKYYFFRKISFLIPAFIIFYYTGSVLPDMPKLIVFVQSLTDILFVFISILILDSILSTINDYYERFDIAKDHPIKSVIQIIKIVIYFIGVLVFIGILINRDLSSLLISLGTLSAVLMLIFKDPILGFVGGLQLVFNKMIKIGDWITVPKFGADGTVLEISLTTVKIQNFDKTIVTVPTYSLITDSFQNWRGMEESGGRRIKRSIYIDMDSIKFVNETMLEKFRKIKVLLPYLEQKQKEIDDYNKKMNIDPKVEVNGRRQTNLGIFRAYLKIYLHNRHDIHDDMTFLIRQLEPTEKGLPIQIYVFTKTVAWVEYEDIQADIFDHILSVLPEFGLRVYQFPKSGDIQALLNTEKNI